MEHKRKGGYEQRKRQSNDTNNKGKFKRDAWLSD